MAPPKKYANSVERYAAYRARRKARAESVPPAEAEETRLLQQIRAETQRAATGTRSQLALNAFLNRLLELLG